MGTKYLNPRQIREDQEEVRRLEALISAPDPEGKIKKAEAGVQLNRLNQRLKDGTPPPTTPERRTQLMHEIANLEKEISQGMPHQHDMDRKTPGTGDRHRRWESANKPNILRWKDLKRELDPTNTDADYTNVETLRPRHDLSQVVPYRQYTGVDIRDGQIVPGGIPDVEKIESRTAAAVVEERQSMEDNPTSCDECGKEGLKGARGLEIHKFRMHK